MDSCRPPGKCPDRASSEPEDTPHPLYTTFRHWHLLAAWGVICSRHILPPKNRRRTNARALLRVRHLCLVQSPLQHRRARALLAQRADDGRLQPLHARRLPEPLLDRPAVVPMAAVQHDHTSALGHRVEAEGAALAAVLCVLLVAAFPTPPPCHVSSHSCLRGAGAIAIAPHSGQLSRPFYRLLLLCCTLAGPRRSAGRGGRGTAGGLAWRAPGRRLRLARRSPRCRSLSRSPLARAGKRLPSGPGGAPSVTTNNLLATGQSGAARRRRRRRTRRKCMPNRARRAPLVVPTGDTYRSQNASILDPDPQRGTNPRAAPIVPGTGAATLRVCHPGILVWLASKASRRASARATSARRRCTSRCGPATSRS